MLPIVVRRCVRIGVQCLTKAGKETCAIRFFKQLLAAHHLPQLLSNYIRYLGFSTKTPRNRLSVAGKILSQDDRCHCIEGHAISRRKINA